MPTLARHSDSKTNAAPLPDEFDNDAGDADIIGHGSPTWDPVRRRREHGDPDETFTKSDDGVGVSPIAVGGDDCGGSSDTVRPEGLQNVPGPARIVEHDDGAGVGSVRRHAVPEHRPPGGRADGGRQAQRKVERVTVGIEVGAS